MSIFLTKIGSRDCGLTILDIDKRFFAINRERNRAKSQRANFYNFVLWTILESEKVKNNLSKGKILKKSTFQLSERRNRKSGSKTFGSGSGSVDIGRKKPFFDILNGKGAISWVNFGCPKKIEQVINSYIKFIH